MILHVMGLESIVLLVDHSVLMVTINLPNSTDTKNKCRGTPTMGERMLRSQLGVMGSTRREMSSSNRLPLSSVNCNTQQQ